MAPVDLLSSRPGSLKFHAQRSTGVRQPQRLTPHGLPAVLDFTLSEVSELLILGVQFWPRRCHGTGHLGWWENEEVGMEWWRCPWGVVLRAVMESGTIIVDAARLHEGGSTSAEVVACDADAGWSSHAGMQLLFDLLQRQAKQWMRALGSPEKCKSRR